MAPGGDVRLPEVVLVYRCEACALPSIHFVFALIVFILVVGKV